MSCDMMAPEAESARSAVRPAGAVGVVTDVHPLGPTAEYIVALLERVVVPLLRNLETALGQPRQEYFSIKEAAVLSGVSTKHIRRAVKRGELQCSNIGGKKRPTYRISRQSIAAWMESCHVRACQSKSQRDDLVEKYFGKQRRQAG